MKKKNYVIAMDQGTTSSRCILFDRQGKVCSVVQKEFPQIYPQPGWVEHNPMEILSTQMGVTMEAMQKIDARPDEIAAIGITNQRETTVVWDAATGAPICNAIVWQCRRTADRIERLRRDGWAETIQRRTGLIPDAYFSASPRHRLHQRLPHHAFRHPPAMLGSGNFRLLSHSPFHTASGVSLQPPVRNH